MGKLGRSSPIYHKFPAKGATCTLITGIRAFSSWPSLGISAWSFNRIGEYPSDLLVTELPLGLGKSLRITQSWHPDLSKSTSRCSWNSSKILIGILGKHDFLIYFPQSGLKTRSQALWSFLDVAMLRVWTLSWLQDASGMDLRVVNLAAVVHLEHTNGRKHHITENYH